MLQYHMKKFSERINADWYTTERLEELLDEFFDLEDYPKTLTHLYRWLNIDWATFVERSLDERFKTLLTAAENECESWVVSHGFANDKSFAKFTLQTQHNRMIATKQEVVIQEVEKCYLPLKDEDN